MITPKAESEEELKSLLMRVKESERAGLRLNIKKKKNKNKIIASSHTTAWQIGENSDDFLFLGSQITVDIDCSHEIRRQLLLGRKTMTNLDSVLNSRDITLLTLVQLVCAMSLHSLCIVLVKAVVFPLVMYGCDSWTIKNAGCQRIDAFELRCWKRLLKVP